MLAAKKHILRHVEFGRLLQFLVNQRNAKILRGARTSNVVDLAGDADFASAGAVDAGQYFQQRRLARAILADQRMHFAGAHVKADIGKRLHAGE